MAKIDLKSVVWNEGKYYISQCLDVDISSYGKNKKEALSMLQEALELYFEDVPFPKKTERVKNPIIASIKLQHAETYLHQSCLKIEDFDKKKK